MKFKISEEYIQDVIKEFSNKVEISDNFNLEKLFEKPEKKDCTAKKFAIVNKNFEYFGLSCRNIIYYPPEGGMGWHTNAKSNGCRRVYCAWSENGNSGMNWYNKTEDKLEIDKDDIGWNIRIFEIPQWHCVWAKCNRISFGFEID